MAKIFKVKLMVTLIVDHLTSLNDSELLKTVPTQPRLSYEIIQLSLFKILFKVSSNFFKLLKKTTKNMPLTPPPRQSQITDGPPEKNFLIRACA